MPAKRKPSPSAHASDPSQPIRLPTRASKRHHSSTLSALASLPPPLLQRYLRPHQCLILSLFAGRLPPCPPTLLPHGSECIGLEQQWSHLYTMLNASLTAREGNSCLLIGASGAGKSLLLESVLRAIDSHAAGERRTGSSSTHAEPSYYRVHLDGSVQTTDRSAMKEIAQQLIAQGAFRDEDLRNQIGDELDETETDASTAALDRGSHDQQDPEDDDQDEQDEEHEGHDHVFGGDKDDDATAFHADADADEQNAIAAAILSSLSNVISHIISLLSTTSAADPASSAAGPRRKPLVITLDDFDLFTARPRQALLYCLLDAVQAGSYGAGLAVVGLTSRVDTTDLLEKRVKSRFSHRILHVRPPESFEAFSTVAQAALLAGTSDPLPNHDADQQRFLQAWRHDVTELLSHPDTVALLRGLYELSNDVRHLYRLLFVPLAALTPGSPALSVAALLASAGNSLGDGHYATLFELTEPELALLIASKHLQTRDRLVFNFEMCLDELVRFVARESKRRTVAASSIASGSIASLQDRRIALMAFQSLLQLEVFLCEAHVLSLAFAAAGGVRGATAGAGGAGAGKGNPRLEYVKVRCIWDPVTIRNVVREREARGVASALVKWANSSGV
ncbi:origin recognition complex subunit 4 [Thecaphora frezii]